MTNFLRLGFLLLGLLLSACSKQADNSATGGGGQPETTAVSGQQEVKRRRDFALVMRGGKLYRQYCAACHGNLAQGYPQWQQANASGRSAAPPLNGSGHAWHHPTVVLKKTIKDGTSKMGGAMPAWGDKLSDKEIDEIIAWFQSHWPDEIYAAWARREKQARAGT